MSAVLQSQAAPVSFPIVFYASETDTIGHPKVGSWPKLVNLFQMRDIRTNKSGRAFAPVNVPPGGSRSKANVLGISLAVADIDDGTTLEDLRVQISQFSWAAYSTHSHDPAGGKFKFRVVFPLARLCTPAEWPDVWRGFNALLSGHCDPACKDQSRLYYLPSCPSSTQGQAFAEDNAGQLVDPAHLIARAGASNLIRPLSLPHHSLLGSNLQPLPPPESPEQIASVKAMLASISADCDRQKWRDVVWALAATGWACAEHLARDWSQSAPAKFKDEEFNKVWASYMPGGGIGFGTLMHTAKEAGYTPPVGLAVSMGTQTDPSGDILNGQEFASHYKDKLLFVHETGDVLQFDERAGWVQSVPGEADRAAKNIVALLRTQAAQRWQAAPDEPKTKRHMLHVARSSNEPKLRAMVNLAKSEPGMTVQLQDLDADPLLLGVVNGVLNLGSGVLLTPLPSLRVTKRCAVSFDPAATAPIFDAFLSRITSGKPELAKYLQRLAGYILTGEVKEHCFAFLYGLGRNGKTTFAELLRWLLGDYAVILPTATLTMGTRAPGAASPDLMLLKGRRLALASELEENARFAEAAIKSMTGGDTMSARNPYGLYAHWTPTHKLMVVGNHRPVISGTDHGIWRRVQLIPFEETIRDDECDKDLPDKLRNEGSGVLNWALTGLKEWQRLGLNPPQEIKTAGAAYQTDMDIVGQWMADHTDLTPGAETPTLELYKAYQAWARDAGWKNPMTRQAFGRRLGERNIPLVKTAKGNKGARDITLNTEGKNAAARTGYAF